MTMLRAIIAVALAVWLAAAAVAVAGHRLPVAAFKANARVFAQARAAADARVLALRHGRVRVVRIRRWGRHGRCGDVRVPVSLSHRNGPGVAVVRYHYAAGRDGGRVLRVGPVRH